MPNFASALSLHPNSFEAAAECAGDLLEGLGGERPDLAVVFASPHHFDAFGDLTAGLRKLLEADVVIGSTAAGVVGGPHEIEDGPALTVFAADWGGGHARPVALDSFPTTDGFRIDGWADDASADGTLLLLADPTTFPVGDFLHLANGHLPDLTLMGGLASGSGPDARCLLSVDNDVRDRGAVGVLLDSAVQVEAVVSQGCRPIGQPFTVTRSERNVVHELAGRPPLERLREVVADLDDTDQELVRRGLHVGVVIDEHIVDFRPGDFLVRNLIGADESSGAIAVGDIVEIGQTVQFHVRDADSADRELQRLIAGTETGTRSADIGALLFTCTGRGQRLFGRPHHDAATIEECLGRTPLAGMFCAGEIGPVGGRHFLHGYTASVALFS